LGVGVSWSQGFDAFKTDKLIFKCFVLNQNFIIEASKWKFLIFTESKEKKLDAVVHNIL
jgi:hypothetical protein